MKTTKIFVLLLTIALVFSLVSCKKDRDDKPSDNSYDFIQDPDDYSSTDDSSDKDTDDATTTTPSEDGTTTDNTDSSTEDADKDDATTQDYVYSINSDRFHLPDCYHISNIKDESKVVHNGTVDELISLGKSPCLTCMPNETVDSEEEIIPEGTTFIINKETKKIHRIDCHSAKTIKKENRIYTQKSYVELLLLDEGYTPCENCDP